MRPNTIVDPEAPLTPQRTDSELTAVDLSSLPADLLSVPLGTGAFPVRPGQGFIINRVLRASQFVAIFGVIRLPLPPKPPNALFFRNDTGRSPFPRVVSIPVQLKPDGSFEGRIDTM